MSRLAAILILLTLIAGPTPEEDSPPQLLPEIGWRVLVYKDNAIALEIPSRGPVSMEAGDGETMTSPTSLDPYFHLTLDGVDYTVVADSSPGGSVTYLATSDAHFRSPEGAQTGQTIGELLDLSGTQLQELPGWACFVCLDSGWAASFPIFDEKRELISCEKLVAKNATATWFFKRRGTCDK